ncbi:hypothetical protein NDU88_007853 [Pleurodeles waltl]|uniref:Uncharacterized protein n=1 Tax=Pleurodeles waltl TaxID=8319 RepID=A0AAV7P202_PLEWA|nr:hypothetical protein NDU88_007853 [Pleurodeles waltl]
MLLLEQYVTGVKKLSQNELQLRKERTAYVQPEVRGVLFRVSDLQLTWHSNEANDLHDDYGVELIYQPPQLVAQP